MQAVSKGRQRGRGHWVTVGKKVSDARCNRLLGLSLVH